MKRSCKQLVGIYACFKETQNYVIKVSFCGKPYLTLIKFGAVISLKKSKIAQGFTNEHKEKVYLLKTKQENLKKKPLTFVACSTTLQYQKEKNYFEQIYFVNMESRLTGEDTIFMQVIPQSDELRFELANYEENKMKKK